MAFTDSQLAAIEAALAKGVLSVRNGEETLTFRSVEELIRAREEITASQRASAGTRVRQYRIATSRGL